jgi:broad specificity phosphatase PhoE
MDMAESERTQTIIFVRHGVALHNLRVGNIAPDLTNPYFLDPSLVPYGVQQAADAGEKIRRWLEQRHGRDRVDLALTSPLTRCFQSTFAILKMSREATECETKIVCCEDLREAYGLHYPDRRRSKSHLMV